MKLGFAGAIAIGAAVTTIAACYAIVEGYLPAMPLLGAIAVGLGALSVAIWQGATRWLLLVLPIFLTPAALIIILFNCAKCIS